MDRGAWWATMGTQTESDMTERLHFHTLWYLSSRVREDQNSAQAVREEIYPSVAILRLPW